MKVIVLEGINAAGKSAIGKRIEDTVRTGGHTCLHVDPAAIGVIGKSLRKNLVSPEIVTTPNIDAALFAALRAEGAKRIIETNKTTPFDVVILERWSLALAAYGAADDATPTLVNELRGMLKQTLESDITLLLNLDGKVAYSRLGKEADENRFENRGSKYLENVASWYRHFATEEKHTTIIDASHSLEKTFERVSTALAPYLNSLGAVDRSDFRLSS